jgi:hypothetical protein
MTDRLIVIREYFISEVFNRKGMIVTNYGITSRTWIENANDRKGMFRVKL